ncbi:MAG: cation-translocating P-type ATPase [Promethearchaeota archaeon]
MARTEIMKQELNDSPYNHTIEELLSEFKSKKTGISSESAALTKKSTGLNKILKKRTGFYKKYIKPVINLMMVILLLAAAVQVYLVYAYDEGSYFSPVTILIILTINIIIGMSQQYKASKTLEALERLTAFKATVLRDDKTIEISSDDLVPGDIILLKQGDYISADARLFEANDLTINESNLTGETNSVNKFTQKINETDLQIQDQKNMVFSSTFVTTGNGKALITATGGNTEIGKISQSIAEVKPREIPLQKQMNHVGRGLGLLVLGIIAVLFIYKLIQGSTDVIGEISWLISLAVTAIPFNFPLITTIILLIGVVRLARKQAIVRNLNAVETMGRLTVICSDKTGTLTKNEMTVQRIYQDSEEYLVTGLGYQPTGKILLDGQEINLADHANLEKLIIIGAVNNQSVLTTEEVSLKKGTATITRVIGIPTEGALLTLANKAKITPNNGWKDYEILKEFSFTSERKRMTQIVKYSNEIQCFTKGAPEILLERSTHAIHKGKILPITEEIRSEYLANIQQSASSGLRNLAFAYSNLEENFGVNLDVQSLSADDVEQKLIFLGITGIRDPPREGVEKSIQQCNEAGIRVSMITGDHPQTALAIATQIGIYHEGDTMVSGAEIKTLTDEEILSVSIFARVAPEDKERIVKAFQSNGEIIAMTGDGVNDSLALENADVGIAMGLTGTDVAKNAADLILTDDAFPTIETAIFHGRNLFNNIRSNIMFLLVCAMIELVVITTVTLTLNQQMFNGFQLIILYSTVHFFPPWGLMFDKYDPKLMKDPPKKVGESLLNKKYLGLLFVQIATVSIVLLALWVLINNDIYALQPENFIDVVYVNPFSGESLVGYVYDPVLSEPIRIAFSEGGDLAILRILKAQTMVFITLVLSEIWIVYEARSIKRSVFQGIFNITLTILILIVLGILALITQYDLAQAYINIVPLSPIDWGVCLGGSLMVVLVSLVYKRIRK